MRDENGLSNVIGAVLVFALVIITLVTIRVTFVPVWEEDAEAAHMRSVENLMVQFKADMDKQIDNGTASPQSHTIPMSDRRASRLFTRVTLPSEVALSIGDKPMAIEASSILIQEQNSLSTRGIAETWTAVTAGDQIQDVTSMEHFRLRINSPATQAGRSVTLRVFDEATNDVGQMRVRVVGQGPGNYSMEVRTLDRDGNVLYDGADVHPNAYSPSHWYVDVLDRRFLYNQVLAAADGPYTVQFDLSGLVLAQTATYTQEDPSGARILIAGGGQERSPWNTTYVGGTLEYRARNEFFSDQTFYLENGAFILKQEEGAVIKVPPHFDSRLVLGTLRVDLTVPSLRGDAVQKASTSPATIDTVPMGHRSVSGLTSGFNITITTAFPELWERLWTDRLEAAGLASASGHFTTATTPTTATLRVAGLDALQGPGDARDVFLTVRQADMNLSITI